MRKKRRIMQGRRNFARKKNYVRKEVLWKHVGTIEGRLEGRRNYGRKEDGRRNYGRKGGRKG